MTELTMAAVAPPRQQDEVRRHPATYADYLAWPDDSAIVEWKDGEIIEHMPPTELHQHLVRALVVVISSFADLTGIGVVHVAPFEVKLWPDGPAREPDILFISKDRLSQLTPQRFEGGPDLVIEIVSSSSARADRERQTTFHPIAVKRFVLGSGWSLVATICLLYTSPSPRDGLLSRMPSSA